MSDQFDTGPLPELTPEQDSAVRRLLAEARHEEPVPADVAARLDAVLADLSREAPAQAQEAAPLIDLAARRRRRNAAALLTAAAAVIVAGFAFGQAIDVSGDSNDGAASGGATVARDDAAGGAEQDSSDGAPGPASAPAEQGFAREKPVQLSSGHLRRDIVGQLNVLTGDPSASTGTDGLAESYSDTAKQACPALEAPAAPGIGDLFPAYYDGIPAVLALGPATNGSLEAQVLSCDTGEPLRSVTVTAP